MKLGFIMVFDVVAGVCVTILPLVRVDFPVVVKPKKQRINSLLPNYLFRKLEFYLPKAAAVNVDEAKGVSEIHEGAVLLRVDL